MRWLDFFDSSDSLCFVFAFTGAEIEAAFGDFLFALIFVKCGVAQGTFYIWFSFFRFFILVELAATRSAAEICISSLVFPWGCFEIFHAIEALFYNCFHFLRGHSSIGRILPLQGGDQGSSPCGSNDCVRIDGSEVKFHE